MASDADEGGGSFWATFNAPAAGPEAGVWELSPLEKLLQESDCSIEAVLEDEEVIQELKGGNDKLLARLRTSDACLKLVEYITCEPPEDASHSRSYRYPFVAVELLTCSGDLVEFFVSSANTQLQDALWAFLDASSPQDMNPVLVGYFSRAVHAMLGRCTDEVLAYLSGRGNTDGLLKSFLDRMHSRSLAELFISLQVFSLSQEPAGFAQMIFPVDGLVSRLLLRLEDSAPTGDTQENIKLVIVELISQNDQMCAARTGGGEDFVAQLTSPQAIRLLVEHVFCGKADTVSASASILSSIVWHSYVVNKAGADVPPSPSTLSPTSPPLLSFNNGGDDDLVNTGMEDPFDDVPIGELQAHEAAIKATSSASPPRSPANHPSTPNAIPPPQGGVMREVCAYFPRIRSLLDAVLARSNADPDIDRCPFGKAPWLGGTTLEVLNLLTMLARTGSEEIFEGIHAHDLLPRCIQIFFLHPWSSMLHCSVRTMLAEVLSSTEGVRPALVLRLLQNGGLVERVVNEYREENKYSSGGRQRCPRVGYMGQLHHMCQGLGKFASQVQDCRTALEAVDGWLDVVQPAVSKTDRLHGEQLGGGIPLGSAGLASSGAAFTSSDPSRGDQSTEEDFVLDDLADLDLPGRADFDPYEGNQDAEFGVSTSGSGWGMSDDHGSPASSNSSDSPTLSAWSAGFDADFSQAPGPAAFDADFSQDAPGSAWAPSFEEKPFHDEQAFGADFSQPQSFAADFNQPQMFDADFSQGNAFEKADVKSAVPEEQAAPVAAPESAGSFWDVAEASADAALAPAPAKAEPTAMAAAPASKPGVWAAPAANKEAPISNGSPWGAFDSSFAPAPVAASAPPPSGPDSIKQEDLLNVLGGGGASPMGSAEKRDTSSPWSSLWPTPAQNAPPIAAVPSTCAPTSSLEASSALDCLSWNAFGPSVNKAPSPHAQSSPGIAAGAWPVQPMGSAAPALSPFGESQGQAVGTENLFALLGGSLQGPAPSPIFPPKPPVPSPVAGSPWPTPPPAQGAWADFGASPSSASPQAGAAGLDPFGPLVPPSGGSTPGTPSSDRSWVADFDPFGS